MGQRWPTVCYVRTALSQDMATISCLLGYWTALFKSCTPLTAQQIWYIQPMLDQCWASVLDGGPTFNQQWVKLNVSCWLGEELSLFQFSPNWSFVSLPRTTTSREWKLLIFVKFETICKSWCINTQFIPNKLVILLMTQLIVLSGEKG